MNAANYVVTQNLLGQFMHAWYENQVSVCARGLFTEDARVDIPERDICVKGIGSIEAEFRQLEDLRSQYGVFRDIHLTHSPAFTELMDGTCLLACDTYSFEPCKENGILINKVEYFFTRINIRCRQEHGVLKIYKLFWRELQGMTPWNWDAAKHFAASKINTRTKPQPSGPIAPEDYLPVRNLATRFTQCNRKDAAMDFVKREDAVLDIPILTEKQTGYDQIARRLHELEQLEEKNDRMYLCIPTLGSPYVAMEGQYAVSCWMTMTFGLRGKAYGRSKEEALIARSVGRTKVTCEKIRGEWKILSYIYEPAYGLDDIAWVPSDRYNVMQCEDNTWREWTEKGAGGTMADVEEIENMIAEWTYGQRFQMPDFMDCHMDILHPEDLKVLITGSTKEPNIGYESVRKRLTHPQANDIGGFDRKEKTPGYHTGSTPLVEIAEDGIHAKGTWIDFAMVDVGGLMGIPKYPKRYMLTVGRYFHSFIKEEGRWRQSFVGWDPLLTLPDMPYDPDKCRGYICRLENTFEFPPMFENFGEY